MVGVRGANRPLLAAHRVGRAAVARLVDLRLARHPPVAAGDWRLAGYPPVAAPPLQVQLVAAHLVAGATDAEPRCARRRPIISLRPRARSPLTAQSPTTFAGSPCHAWAVCTTCLRIVLKDAGCPCVEEARGITVSRRA